MVDKRWASVLSASHRTLLAGAAMLIAWSPKPATADTIYLKNGRTIDTASVTLEEDRVLFLQFGHPVAIPKSEIDRIEDNDNVGPKATPTSRPAVPPERLAPPQAPPAREPEQTKEYWQRRVRMIRSEAAALQAELERLRLVESAFLFASMSTADTRRQIEDLQARIEANEKALPGLRREARRKGIPPGWLRLRRGG